MSIERLSQTTSNENFSYILTNYIYVKYRLAIDIPIQSLQLSDNFYITNVSSNLIEQNICLLI